MLTKSKLQLFEGRDWMWKDGQVDLTTYGRLYVMGQLGYKLHTITPKDMTDSIMATVLMMKISGKVVDTETLILANDTPLVRNLAWLNCVKSLYIRVVEPLPGIDRYLEYVQIKKV